MKLESYTPQVSGNVIHGNISSPNLPAAFGGDTSGMNALAGALGKAAETLQAQWIKNQNNNVIDANNDYRQQINTLLYDEKTGLVNTMQGKDAEQLQQAYVEAEKKIRAAVAEKYKINNKYAVNAFENQINPSVTSDLATIDRYQRKGLEVYKTTQEAGYISNFENQISRDPSSLTAQWGKTSQAILALRTELSQDEETKKLALKTILNNSAQKILQNMNITEDYKNGMKAVSEFRANGVDESILKPFEDVFQKKEISATAKDDVAKYVKEKNINLTKLTADEFVQQYDQDHPFTMPTIAGVHPKNPKILQYMDDFLALQKEFGWSDEVLRRFIAMGDHENAGTWDPKIEAGNGDGGLGLYQFMPETAAQYGLTDRTDPHANIRAAGKMFNESLKLSKGDLDKATLMHNGGQSEEGVRNAAAAGYLEKVKDDEAGLFGSGYSEEELAHYKETRNNAIKSQYMELRHAQEQEISNLITQINKTRLEMSQAGDNIYKQYEVVQNLIESNPILKDSPQGINLMQGMVNAKKAQENEDRRVALASKGYNPDGSLTDNSYQFFVNQIGVTIRTRAELEKAKKQITDDGGHLSPRQADDLEKQWSDYQRGEGPHAIDIRDDTETIAALTGLEKSKVTPEALGMIRQEIYDYMNDKEKNPKGYFPDQEARRKIYQNVLIGHQIGQTMYYHTWGGLRTNEISLSLSDMEKRRLKIDEISPAVDAKGRPTGFYIKSSEDGVTRYVTYDQAVKLKNNELTLAQISNS